LLNNEQKFERSVATEVHSSTTAGFINFFQIASATGLKSKKDFNCPPRNG